MTAKSIFLKCTGLMTPCLLIVAVSQIVLLYSILSLPEGLQTLETKLQSTPFGYLFTELNLLLEGFSSGPNSLEFARTLKAHATSRHANDPLKEESDLRWALAIEKSFHSLPWQTHLDHMEIVDSLTKLSDLKRAEGRDRESLDLLQEAYMLVKVKNLYWIRDPVEKYKLLLDKHGYIEQAQEVSNTLDSWKRISEIKFQQYLKARTEYSKHVPESLEHGAAVPFLADASRILEKDLALAGRKQEALAYAENCVQLDSLLPESEWHKPADLAELALLYTEMEQFAKAAIAYRNCVNAIIQSPNPDILFILPQRQSFMHLALFMNRPRDLAQSRESAEDIVQFLNQLKCKKKTCFPESHKWIRGDLVQIRWDERWWSAIVLQNEQNQGGNTRVRIHFVGFPQTQNDYFSGSDIRQHPPYGYSALQNPVPQSLWQL